MVGDELADIGMVEHLQVFDLAVGLLRIGWISKCIIYLLECHRAASLFVFGLPDLAIRALADLLNDLEVLQDVVINRIKHPRLLLIILTSYEYIAAKITLHLFCINEICIILIRFILICFILIYFHA